MPPTRPLGKALPGGYWPSGKRASVCRFFDIRLTKPNNSSICSVFISKCKRDNKKAKWQ
jgi:hypothetical protein